MFDMNCLLGDDSYEKSRLSLLEIPKRYPKIVDYNSHDCVLMVMIKAVISKALISRFRIF